MTIEQISEIKGLTDQMVFWARFFGPLLLLGGIALIAWGLVWLKLREKE